VLDDRSGSERIPIIIPSRSVAIIPPPVGDPGRRHPKKGFFIDKVGESFYMPPLIIKEFYALMLDSKTGRLLYQTCKNAFREEVTLNP
jgi:hypothetical protein